MASSSAIRSGYSAFPLGIEQRFPQAGAGLAIDDIGVVRLAFGSIMIRSVFPMMPSCGPRGAKVASKADSRAIISRSFPRCLSAVEDRIAVTDPAYSTSQ
jgi:hypothetical protein